MSPSDEAHRLAAEQRARVLIDQQLEAAGWVVGDKKDLNLFAGPDIQLSKAWNTRPYHPVGQRGP